MFFIITFSLEDIGAPFSIQAFKTVECFRFSFCSALPSDTHVPSANEFTLSSKEAFLNFSGFCGVHLIYYNIHQSVHFLQSGNVSFS
jgi:hypothetical protein